MLTAGCPLAGYALKALEPYAVKIARTVLRGRKLPGVNIVLSIILTLIIYYEYFNAYCN